MARPGGPKQSPECTSLVGGGEGPLRSESACLPGVTLALALEISNHEPSVFRRRQSSLIEPSSIRVDLAEIQGGHMAKPLTVGVAVLVLACSLSIPLGRLAAQEAALTWMVVTYKMQLVEGRPMMMLMGPFPSSSMCDAMLKFAQEGLSRQGLEMASPTCRKDVTVAIPDQRAPRVPNQVPAGGDGARR